MRPYLLLCDNAASIQVWVSNHFSFLFMTIFVFVLIIVSTSPRIHFNLFYYGMEISRYSALHNTNMGYSKIFQLQNRVE